MAKFNKKKIFKQALDVIKEKQCLTIEEVVSFLPCSKTTFYDFFPATSEESEAVKDAIGVNCVKATGAMIRNWIKSDAPPALQMGAMKILGTEEQAHRLNGSKMETTLKGDAEHPISFDDEVGRNKLIAELSQELKHLFVPPTE